MGDKPTDLALKAIGEQQHNLQAYLNSVYITPEVKMCINFALSKYFQAAEAKR